MSDTLHYPIRAVARMTGISVDTLRAWERRYEAVVPVREGRGRTYSGDDVARLKLLGALVRRGHAIGTIAGLSGETLDGLLKGSDALRTQVAPPAALDAAPLLDALERYDLDLLESMLNRFALLLPPRDLIFGVVLPLLQDIGKRWESGRLRPAQEHAVSAIVRSVLGGLLRSVVKSAAPNKVVFATPAGERHELGLLCGALLAAASGYGVVYLGPDLPADEIVHATVASGARSVVIGLTSPKAVSMAELKRLEAVGGSTTLVVGGPERRTLPSSLKARSQSVETLADLVPTLDRHA